MLSLARPFTVCPVSPPVLLAVASFLFVQHSRPFCADYTFEGLSLHNLSSTCVSLIIILFSSYKISLWSHGHTFLSLWHLVVHAIGFFIHSDACEDVCKHSLCDRILPPLLPPLQARPKCLLPLPPLCSLLSLNENQHLGLNCFWLDSDHQQSVINEITLLLFFAFQHLCRHPTLSLAQLALFSCLSLSSFRRRQPHN